MKLFIYLLILITTPIAFSQWDLISPEIQQSDLVNYSITDIHFINKYTGLSVGRGKVVKN